MKMLAIITIFSLFSFNAKSEEFTTLNVAFYGYPSMGGASSTVEICDDGAVICKTLSSSESGVYAHTIELKKIEDSITDLLSNKINVTDKFTVRVVSKFKTLGTSDLSSIISEFKVVLSSDQKIQTIRAEEIYQYGSTHQEFPLSSDIRFIQIELQTHSDSFGKFLGIIPNLKPVTLISIF